VKRPERALKERGGRLKGLGKGQVRAFKGIEKDKKGAFLGLVWACLVWSAPFRMPL